MARRSSRRSRAAHVSDGPPLGEFPIDSGVASLEPDEAEAGAYTLFVNGVPSSPYSPDPRRLGFAYLEWMAAVVDAVAPEAATLRAVHIGGAGCALARRIDADRPGSRQTVVEIDSALAEWVRTHLDIPRSPALAIRVADGAEEILRFRPESLDLCVRDAFAGDAVPEALSSPEFSSAAAAALRGTGVLLANVADGSDRTALRRELEGLSAAFPHVLGVADRGEFRRRRRANLVLAASASPLPAGRIAAGLRGPASPPAVLSLDDLRSALG